MAPVRRFLARLGALLRPSRAERELNRELSSHVALLAEEFQRQGMTPEDAARAAVRSAGGIEQAKERHRDARSFAGLENVLRDVRYALRTLGRAPSFTAVVVATLALGIGASVGIFSVVYGVLIRPLPYRDAERLIVIRATQQLPGIPRPAPAAFDVATLQSSESHWRSFERFVYSSPNASTTLARPQGAEMIDTAVVSREFFSALGARALVGRPLGPIDDLSPVAVISDRLWDRLFNRSSSVLGQQITLQSVPYTVVGVLAPEFQLPVAKTDAWMPLGFANARAQRGYSLSPIATLKAGVSLDHARAEVDAWARATAQQRQYVGIRIMATSLAADISREAKRPLVVLLAAVTLLLVVACANVANLLLARNASRAREWEVRAALGASRTRIVAQRMTEVAILAGVGTAAGLVIAQLIVGAMSRVSTGIPRLDGVAINGVALAFATAVAILVTIATGGLSSFHAYRTGQGRTSTEPKRVRRLRGALCAVEIAVALVLLVGASLLGRTLASLLTTDLGATTERVASASLLFPASGRQPPARWSDQRVRETAGRITERIRALPGVQRVGLGTSLPIGGSRIRITLVPDDVKQASVAAGIPATPDYFHALGMRLVEGRFFTDADDDQHPQVGILTVETARRYFPDGSAIGRVLSLPRLRDGVSSGQVDLTIVGVVRNVKYSSVDAPPEDAMYRPFAQQPWGSPFLVVRTTGDPGALGAVLRKQIAAVDPNIVVSLVRPLDEVVSASVAAPRFRALVLGALALAAVTLAAVGLAGAIAYSVSRRTAEFGIRIALGAMRRDVLRLVFKETGSIIVAGGAAGVVLALLMTRLLANLLYGVKPADPWSFVGGTLGLAVVALVATYLPARRAADVDPLAALRSE